MKIHREIMVTVQPHSLSMGDKVKGENLHKLAQGHKNRRCLNTAGSPGDILSVVGFGSRCQEGKDLKVKLRLSGLMRMMWIWTTSQPLSGETQFSYRDR